MAKFLNYIFIVLLILSIAVFFSCSPYRSFYSRKDRKEQGSLKKYLKQWTYCKCLENNIERFSTKDTLEGSIGGIDGLLLDYYFINYKDTIFTVLNGITKNIVVEEEKEKNNDSTIAEGAIGKTSYFLSCLDLYHSKQLDSTLRILIKMHNKKIRKEMKKDK